MLTVAQETDVSSRFAKCEIIPSISEILKGHNLGKKGVYVNIREPTFQQLCEKGDPSKQIF